MPNAGCSVGFCSHLQSLHISVLNSITSELFVMVATDILFEYSYLEQVPKIQLMIVSTSYVERFLVNVQ